MLRDNSRHGKHAIQSFPNKDLVRALCVSLANVQTKQIRGLFFIFRSFPDTFLYSVMNGLMSSRDLKDSSPRFHNKCCKAWSSTLSSSEAEKVVITIFMKIF